MDASTPNLKLVVQVLAEPPFSKPLTPIQLHDDVPPIQLLQLASDVLAHLDAGNSASLHARGKEVRNELPEDVFWRMSETLRMLKFKPAQPETE